MKSAQRADIASRSIVAAFDVDKTLTVRDCVVPFMRRIAGQRRFASIVGRHSLTLSKAVTQRDRDLVKSIMVREIFRGRSAADVAAIGVDFAALVTAQWLRRDVVERLRFHQEAGHQVLLVSASLDAYLDPIGSTLEVDAVLCTRLHRDDSNTLTGEILGPNCRGRAKVSALEEWGGSLDGGSSWLDYAYGDSPGDEFMLGAAIHGINVSRTILSRAC